MITVLYILTCILWGLFSLKNDRLMFYDKYEKKWGHFLNQFRHYGICGLGNAILTPLSMILALRNFKAHVNFIKKT